MRVTRAYYATCLKETYLTCSENFLHSRKAGLCWLATGFEILGRPEMPSWLVVGLLSVGLFRRRKTANGLEVGGRLKSMRSFG